MEKICHLNQILEVLEETDVVDIIAPLDKIAQEITRTVR